MRVNQRKDDLTEVAPTKCGKPSRRDNTKKIGHRSKGRLSNRINL